MKVFVNGVGLLGPGLSGWNAGREVLDGSRRYVWSEPPRPAGEILPAGERRRSSVATKAALQVAGEAMGQSGIPADSAAVVFASSNGDADTLHAICEALATPEREVSPTRFHNSVHNASAGYWSIASGSRRPSTTISAWDHTFAAGFLEAALQAGVERTPVLLAAYEPPCPFPLSQVRPTGALFAAALLLAPEPGHGALAALSWSLDETGEPAGMDDLALEAVRLDSPAARALPLLALLARREAGEITLAYAGGLRLRVEVVPCP